MALLTTDKVVRIFNKFRGTRGWIWLYERQLALARMHNQLEAERRLRILIFWEKFGDLAAAEAFKVSRRTLYRWQQALQRGEGKVMALDKKSTAPKRRRRRIVLPELLQRIVDLRTAHPRLGKKKVGVLCGISGSKAGRILSDIRRRDLIPAYTPMRLQARTGRLHEKKWTRTMKIRRPKQNKRGIEIDTVIRFVKGTKRYIYTAIDIERKFAFGGAYTNHSSQSAADFLDKLIEVAPFPIEEIQTDNGSEFAHLFHDALAKRNILHYHTYPRCPKMNGTVERFNRTLSEEFISHHLSILRDDLTAFNEALVDYLLWYNTERPHESLSMVSPLRYIVNTLSAEECQMYWTRTVT